MLLAEQFPCEIPGRSFPKSYRENLPAAVWVRACAMRRTRDGDIRAAFLELAFDIPAMASRFAPRSNAFQNNSDALAHSDAHGAQSVAAFHALKLIRRGGGQARAAGAERVADGDRAPIRIYVHRVIR